jgi:hypothetical protein
MNNKKNPASIDQKVQRYDELRPVMRQILNSTASFTWRMMKFLVKTAFSVPRFVKQLTSKKNREPRT